MDIINSKSHENNRPGLGATIFAGTLFYAYRTYPHTRTFIKF